MNSRRILVAVFAGCLTLALTAHAQVSPIRIDVDPVISHPKVESKSAKPKSGKKPTTPQTEAQQEYLVITLQNVSGQSFSGLTVRHAIFADDVATDAITVAGSGQQTVNLTPLGRVSFETAPVTVTHKDASKRKTAPKSTGSSKDKPKKPAGPTGKELEGYGVQVMQGGTVLAEYFSDPALKSKMGSAPAASEGKAKAKTKEGTQPAKPKKPKKD